MNYEARLISLTRLKSEIEAATKTRAMDANESYDPALAAKVERWIQIVAIAQQQIKSGHHLNALQYQHMRFAKDRSARFGAGQRFTNREANLEKLFQASVEVVIALGALLRQKGPEKPGEAKAIEAIGNAMQNILKSLNGKTDMVQNFTLGQEQQIVSASVRQLQREAGAPPGTVGAFPVIDLFTLILAYFALLKTLRK